MKLCFIGVHKYYKHSIGKDLYRTCIKCGKIQKFYTAFDLGDIYVPEVWKTITKYHE